MNEICKQCPLVLCNMEHDLCEQSVEFKLHQIRSLTRLPMYHGSGRWDRANQKRGIRKLAQRQRQAR